MPLPVPPMTALVWPGSSVNDTSSNRTIPVIALGLTGCGGSMIAGVVSNTCSTRSALAIACGNSTTIITAIITAIRICMM